MIDKENEINDYATTTIFSFDEKEWINNLFFLFRNFAHFMHGKSKKFFTSTSHLLDTEWYRFWWITRFRKAKIFLHFLMNITNHWN